MRAFFACMLAYSPGLLATVPSPHGRLSAVSVFRLSDYAAHTTAKRFFTAFVSLGLRVRRWSLEVTAGGFVIPGSPLGGQTSACFCR